MRSFIFKPSWKADLNRWKFNINFFLTDNNSTFVFEEYSHAPKMLSHISNRPRVAYLVLVMLISHG